MSIGGVDPPIRRRDLLAGIGTGLCAGCLSDDPDPGTPSSPGPGGTATPGQTTADDSTPPSPEAPSDPTDESVTLTATVMDSFTVSSPGRLRLTLANRTNDLLLALGIRRGIDGPFTAIRGRRRDDGRELLLFYRDRELSRYALCADSSETPIPEERIEDCWQPQCATGLELISTHGTVILGPGETLSGEYTVLDGFDDDCLTPGTYAFTDDASELGSGTRTDDGVEFGSDPTRIVRQLGITLGEDGTVAASAEAVPQTDDNVDTSPTSTNTPESVSRNSTSD